MAQLVEDGARSEAHARLLHLELGDAEDDIGWLRDALASATEKRVANDRAAGLQQQHGEEELGAERRAGDKLRNELRELQSEQTALVGRLAASQRVNDEWQERVRAVSAEFEARTLEWQEQLQLEATK